MVKMYTYVWFLLQFLWGGLYITAHRRAYICTHTRIILFALKDTQGILLHSETMLFKFTKGSRNTDFNNANNISSVPSGVMILDILILYFDFKRGDIWDALGSTWPSWEHFSDYKHRAWRAIKGEGGDRQ